LGRSLFSAKPEQYCHPAAIANSAPVVKVVRSLQPVLVSLDIEEKERGVSCKQILDLRKFNAFT
jgi:hypothetical protein